MNIIEHVRKHSGAVKIIVTAGFLAGLAISSYSSAYASYTGKTDTKYNAYALKQAQSTVYYAKEPQRVLMWNNGQSVADIVGKRDGTVDNNGDYWAVDNTDVTAGYISDASKQSVGNYDSNISIPIQTTGKVHRVQITGDAPLDQAGQAGNDTGYRGSFVHPYWTLADGTVKRTLTEGKKYVLFCYAKGKGRWMIGDEQNGENIRNAASGVHEYTLSENSWTKVEQVFTAGTESEYTAFIQYSHLPSVGDYCDVTDVFIAEIQETQSRDVLNQVGSFADGSSQLGFQGWSNTPDKCGVGYDSSDADAKTTDIVPVEGRVYYPVIKRYAIDVNAIINNNYIGDGIQSSTNFVPANLTLKINGVAVANNRHGDIFTSAPAGSTYSLTVNSVDAGYRFKGYSSNDYGVILYSNADEVDSRLIYFKVNIKKNTSAIVEAPTTTESGTLNSTVAFNLMLSTYYKITWNLDGGSGTYEDTYETTDNDYAVTPPTKDGYAFAGWTGTGLSGTTRNLVIPKGSTGDRAYTAHWGTPIRVRCEEWTEDVNGNPYRKIYTYPKTEYVLSGTKVSALEFGGHRNSAYLVDKYETITADESHNVVRKFVKQDNIVDTYKWGFMPRSTGDAEISHPQITLLDSKGAILTLHDVTIDVDIRYSDKNGNILKQEHKTLKASNGIAYNARFGNGCDGITISINRITDDYQAAQWRNVDGMVGNEDFQFNKFTKPDYPYITVRNRDIDQTFLLDNTIGYTDFGYYEYTWDDGISDFQKLPAHYISGSDDFNYYFNIDNNKVQFNDIPRTKINRGARIKLGGGEVKNNKWIVDDSNVYFTDDYENSAKMTSSSVYSVHSHFYESGLAFKENAYGVVFDANGGIGDMDGKCIRNYENESSRKLPANTFVSFFKGKTFKGWATSRERANAGIVDYADNAVMPTDTTNICKTITLYAVWG